MLHARSTGSGLSRLRFRVEHFKCIMYPGASFLVTPQQGLEVLHQVNRIAHVPDVQTSCVDGRTVRLQRKGVTSNPESEYKVSEL